MGEEWQVIFYQEDNGFEPARCFLEGTLTEAEKKQFRHRVRLLCQMGLGLLGTEILEKITGEDNLYELRLPNTPHNPRFLLCALSQRRLVLLHGFSKKARKPRSGEIVCGLRRRDAVLAAEENQ